jgi:cytochrome c oxidase subunit 3
VGLLAKLSEKPWVKSQSDLDNLHEGGTFRIPAPWLGLNLLFAVIGVLFLLLSIAYYHHRVIHAAEYQAAAAQSASFLDLCLASGPAWLGLPKLWLLWVNTAILFAGSVAMQGLQGATRRGEKQSMRDYLIIAGALTSAFLVGQILVGRQLASLGFFAATTPAVAFFLIIALLHGLHVFGGLVPLGRVGQRLMRGDKVTDLRLIVELCTAYWHFLLVVWLLLFGMLLLT